MRLTTKARFAVTAMLDIAMHADGAPIALMQISERQQITVAYLEQIFCKLRRAGLVESVRGPGGGYRLTRSPEEINVGTIIDAVEENLDATQCGGDGKCQGGASCLTHHLWESLNGVTQQFLDGVTLASMVRSHRDRAQKHVSEVPAKIPVKKTAKAKAA